jgi:cation transport regulator ChaB
MMKTSKCCGAKIILTDICSACKEHADAVDRRDDNIRRSSTVHYPDWDLINKKYITRKRG